MKAFKGFSQELKSTYGNGTADGCFFQPGETKEESECKVMRNGFHCYENPFDCLSYYPMDGKNQLWLVEAVSYRITCNNGNQRTLINP